MNNDIMTLPGIYNEAKKQLAYEFNCSPDDFSKDENTITTSILHEKRRKFSEEAFFIQMATFGKGTVISADESIHSWLQEWIKGKSGIWLFEQHNFFDLEMEIRKSGYKMSLTHHMFLPSSELINIDTDLKIKWLEQEEIKEYYGREEFSNAICDHFRADRPDVLAVVALDENRIMGMAGCSADSPKLWQIGIDVNPEYRGRGIAKTLVTLLRNEVFRRGAIPYYGTSLSNLASWKTALSSGFTPAWIEVESRKITEKNLQNDNSRKNVISEDQIAFMKKIGISIDFNNISDDDVIEIEEKVSEHLQKKGFNEDYSPNKDGEMCESILDML